MTPEQQAAYAESIERILKDIEEHDAKTIEEALRLLERTRGEVVEQLKQNSNTEFDLARLSQVQAAIDSSLDRFQRELTDHVTDALDRSFDLGARLVDEPIRGALGQQYIAGLGREQVLVAAKISADLITSVTGDTRSAINAVLGRVITGGLTFQQGIDEVSNSLSDPGIFKSVAKRAQTIVRTEVLRIQSIATQARLEAHGESIQRAGYILEKAWLTAGDTRVREAHKKANGQVKPVTEPFEVGGELLMFPRDPKASAKNSIDCRCHEIPVLKKAA